jgi:putative membrane protein
MPDPRCRNRPLPDPAVLTVLALLASSMAPAWAQPAKFPQTHSPTQAQPLTTVEGDLGEGSVPGSRAIIDDLTPELFLRRAAENGRAAVQLAQVALQRAGSMAVRDFALRAIADHGRTNQEIETLAREMGIPLPDGLDVRHRATLETLQVMEGQAFDEAYLGAVQRDQQRSIAMFETAIGPGLDEPQLIAFARRTLPVLRAHAMLRSQAQAGER